MIIKINAPLGFSEIGARAKQEDALYPQLNTFSADTQVIVMCDGLGGYSFGDVASNTVARTLGQWLENNVDVATISEDNVFLAVTQAQAMLNEAHINNNSSSMGTTMALLAISDRGVVAAHIGDTRIYHIRPSQNAILYRSRDHSLVNDLFVMGKLTRDEVESSSKRNVLTRAMIPNKVTMPDVALITDIEAGDYFFLCTDGVTETLSDKKLLEVLTRNDMVDQSKLAELQMLVKGSRDNRTAVLIGVDRVIHETNENLFVANEDSLCDKMVYLSHISAASQVAAAHQPTSPVAPATEPEYVAEASTTQEVPEVEDTSTFLPPEVPEVATTIPPEVPPTEQFADDSQNPIAPTPETKQKRKGLTKNKRALMIAGLILLGAILLAAGIYSFFNNKTTTSDTTKDANKAQVDDTLPNVSIDSLLPEMPTDSLPVGSNIAVPRAPGISNVTLPNTSSTDGAATPGNTPAVGDKKSPSGRFDTGSNVKVPRLPKYNGSNTPPYDPYDGTENFGSDEPIHDDDDVAPVEKEIEKPIIEEPKPKEPEPKASNNTPGPPQRRFDKNGNAIGSVPPPPSKRKPIETP